MAPETEPWLLGQVTGVRLMITRSPQRRARPAWSLPSEADQSDLVSELESFQKLGCQWGRGSSSLVGTDPPPI